MPRAQSIHFFAGAGGDTIAAELAGVQPVLAANHWTRAVDTHADNYPHVEHVIGDLSVADPKKLPRGFANVMLASPECDFHSSARNHREALAEMRPWDPRSAAERSRCTMFCPQRWAAYHRFDTVVMENVVDVVRWRSFNSWCDEWDKLGYRLQAVFANSAFFGAPQSRDRAYFVATRKEIPAPNLDFRPPAWCWDCEQQVAGIQTWKEAAIKKAGPVGPAGKYGPRAQYTFRCPHCAKTVAPFIQPAWTAIDWSLPAQRIGDRATPLKQSTIDRNKRGLAKLGYTPQLVPLAYTGDDKRRPRPMWLPAQTMTGRQEIGLMAADGFQVDLRGTNQPRPFSDPLSTVAASGNHHGFVVMNNANNVPRGLDEPVGAITGGNRHYVVEAPPSPEMMVQVGGNTFERPGYARAWSVDDPMVTVTGQADRGVFARPIEVGEGFAVANFSPGHVRDTTQEPLGSLTAIPQTAIFRAPREALLSSYYGQGGERSTNDPIGTVTGKDRHALIEPPHGFLARSGGTKQADVVDARSAPAPTRMPTDNYGVAQPNGVELEDCTFRMIAPHECQRVMNMHTRPVRKPDGSVEHVPYRLTGPNRDQVKMSGNGVTPDVEAAILDRCLTAAGC